MLCNGIICIYYQQSDEGFKCCVDVRWEFMMGLTPKIVWHEVQNHSATKWVARERPELTMSLHDEVSIDVAVCSLDIKIQIYGKRIPFDHFGSSPFGITFHRANNSKCSRQFPFGVFLSREPCVDNLYGFGGLLIVFASLYPLTKVGVFVA